MNSFENNLINMHGEYGKAWLESLPEVIKSIADKYDLSGLIPVKNLSYNYVLSGYQANLPIILKLSFDANSLRQETTALKAFEGFGTVKVLAQEKKMVLLQRAIPGHSLKSYSPAKDEDAIRIVCDVMKRLHQAPLPKAGFPNIKDWLLALDKDWDIPIPYLEKARKTRDRLLKTSSEPVLLHGDLHHDNILENGNEWVVIDPKGIIGESEYEVASFIRNPIPELLTLDNASPIIETRITRFADFLELAPSRILEWCFVQAVLSWIWVLEDNGEQIPFKRLTEIFHSISKQIKNLGTMDIKTKHIKVLPYNPDWPKMFEAEAEKIKKALSDNCIAIHHVGSTSIPGLAAKPKIDIIATVKDPEKAIPDLKNVDFTYKGEWNIPFKYGFTKRGELEVNLHVYEKDHPEIELNLLFRDYLRSHPEARDEYAALKENLLKDGSSFQKDNSLFTGYNLGKDAFIRKVLEKAGFNQIRFLKCVHYAEWDAAKYFRQTYFFDKVPVADPYTWTFNHADHVHFVLYQGLDIIGYAHVQLWPNRRAALRIIVVETPKRSQGFGGKFLGLIERWLKLKGYQRLHTESSPKALAFYEHHGYIPMPFDDPDGNKTDPRDTPVGKLLN